MNRKILLFWILMTRPSFQDGEVNPFCSNQSGLETFEEVCCPKCTQNTNKENCRYECPIDYYRFGKICYEIPSYNKERLMPFSPFECNRKCPETHYGIALNDTKICVSCSILCLDTFIETSCSCPVAEKGIDMETLLLITNVITALLFIAATCISISCFYKKRKMCKRSETESMRNCVENHNIETKVEQLDEIISMKTMDTQHKAEEINDKKTIDTDHKVEKDIAVAVQRQHEKITRYTPDPTILRKKKEKEKDRIQSSDYANVSAIRINKLLNRKTISRAVGRLFGRKQETNNSKSIEDEVIEQHTTTTQRMHGDEVNCPSNIQFAEQTGAIDSIVASKRNKVQENKQHESGYEHKNHTVTKTTQLSKSNVLESETIDKTKDNRDTTNIHLKTVNSTPNAIDPVEIKTISNKHKKTNKYLHDTNRNAENISMSTIKTEREIGQKDETSDSIKVVTFAADTNTTTKFEACTDNKDGPISDQVSNEIYENFTLQNNFSDGKLEEQTDLNHLVRKNKSLLRIADRGSKTSTNSNKSTISSNSKSAESDVSNLSYTTAPSGSPRLSDVEDTDQYLHNEDTEEQTVYENISYLSEMEADFKQNSESHTTEINELDNGAITDTKNHPGEILAAISENVEDSQIVTTIDNRDSSGSDESYHSTHNQCLDLESRDASHLRYNAINATKSIDLNTITSQTNMSFNNSTVNLVINQSN